MIDPNEFPWSQIISVLFALIIFFAVDWLKSFIRRPEIIIIRPTIIDTIKMSLGKDMKDIQVFLKNVGAFPTGFWFFMMVEDSSGSILDIKHYSEHETNGPLDKEEIRGFPISVTTKAKLLKTQLVYFSKGFKRNGFKFRYHREYTKFDYKEFPIGYGEFSPIPDGIFQGEDIIFTNLETGEIKE